MASGLHLTLWRCAGFWVVAASCRQFVPLLGFQPNMLGSPALVLVPHVPGGEINDQTTPAKGLQMMPAA
jgi:hypothetical protein